MTEKKAVEESRLDQVSLDALVSKELDSSFSRKGDKSPESVALLDTLSAYAKELERNMLAGPRRRITADDLDRMIGDS